MLLSFLLCSPWVHPYCFLQEIIISLTFYLYWSLLRQIWNQNSFFLWFLTPSSMLSRLWGDYYIAKLYKIFLPSLSNPVLDCSRAICSLIPSDIAVYHGSAGEGLHSFLSAHHTPTSWLIINPVSSWSTSHSARAFFSLHSSRHSFKLKPSSPFLNI